MGRVLQRELLPSRLVLSADPVGRSPGGSDPIRGMIGSDHVGWSDPIGGVIGLLAGYDMSYPCRRDGFA